LRELWINNQLVDLYDSEPIALTKQVNQLNELKDRQADYSNQFSIPPSGNNLRICGFADRVSSDSINPYTKLSCTFIENGSELVSNGIAIIEEYLGGDIQLTVYSGIFDFFDTIGDKTLRDLDLSDADHVFNIENVIASNHNDKYVYPLIQWGATDKENNEIDIRYQVPCLRVSYLIDKIFGGTNYNKDGTIFNSNEYKNLVIPIVADSLIDEPAVLLANSFKAHTEENIIAPYGAYVQRLDMFYFGSGDAFDSTANLYRHTSVFNGIGRYYRYTANNNESVDIRFGLYVRGVPHLDPLIWVSQNGVIGTSAISLDSEGNGTKYINGALGSAGMTGVGDIQYVQLEILNVPLKAGDYVELYYHNDIKEVYVDGSVLGNPDDYSFFSVTAVNTFEVGQTLSLTQIAPQIKQKDLLKTIAQLYGIIFEVDNLTRTVNFNQFQDIVDNKLTNYVDWSDKLYLSKNPRDPNNPSIKYRFGSYSQYNFMRWIQDDDRGAIGDAPIFIDDNTLKKEGDLFTSVFASSIQEINLKGNTGVNIKRFTRVQADSYNNLTEYNEEDLVLYNGIVYEAQQEAVGITPDSDIAYWVPLEWQYEKTESVQPRLLLIRDFDNQFSPPALVYTDGDNSETVYPSGTYIMEVESVGESTSVINVTGCNDDIVEGDYIIIEGTTFDGTYLVGDIVGVDGDPTSRYYYVDGVFTLGQIGSVTKATNQKIAYFSDSLQPYDLTHQYIISKHYPGLQGVLDKSKIVPCKFYLTENEYKNINFFKAVYVDYFGSFFYINVVPNFISGRLASVELVRL
jgi:hypothetical protein